MSGVMDNLKLNIKDLAKIKSDKISLEEKLEIIKCSRTYITSLPYDLRATSWDKLSERYDACGDEIRKRKSRLDNLIDQVPLMESVARQYSQMIGEIDNKIKQAEFDNKEFKERDDYVRKEKEKLLREVLDINQFNPHFGYSDKIWDLSTTLRNGETSILTDEQKYTIDNIIENSESTIQNLPFFPSGHTLPQTDEKSIENLKQTVEILKKVREDDTIYSRLPQLYEKYTPPQQMNEYKTERDTSEEYFKQKAHEINEIRNEIKVLKNEMSDLSEEQYKTAKKMDDLGLLMG